MAGESNEPKTGPPGRTILSGTIAKKFEKELEEGLAKLDRQPKLVGLLANKDEAARTYAEYTKKSCEDLGFAFDLKICDKEDLEEVIVDANEDASIDGIIVYFPVFGNRQDQYLQQVISKDKDVEGLSHLYVQNMYHNIRFLDEARTQKSILPCTPLAIVKILEYVGVYNMFLPYGNRLYGKTITIVNRSEIVGRPLAALLANDGAHVYSVDLDGIQQFTRGEGLKSYRHKTVDTSKTLEEVASISDVIITGVPSKSYKFPTNLVKYGAVCINFSSEKNFDPSVKERASVYVPQTGKVTVAMLLRNLLRLINNRKLAAAGGK